MSELEAVHETSEGIANIELTPPHPPRVETPIYRATHHQLVAVEDRPCVICGVKQSTLNDPAQNPFSARALETHHYPVERSLLDACDWQKLQAKFPAITGPERLEDVIDSEANMLVLCLTGEMLVLMADGTKRAIETIRPGDYVIGKDLLPHRVTATLSRWIEEDIVEVDGVRMTANHPVLTPNGWQEAGGLSTGQVVYQIGVFSPDMLGMTGVELQVAEPVVESVPVNVVNALLAGQRSVQMLLHHPAMLQNATPPKAIPIPATPIAGSGDLRAAQSTSLGSRALIQSDHTTIVGTEMPATPGRIIRLHGKRTQANRTFHIHPSPLQPLAMDRATRPRAGAVTVSEIDRHLEVSVADAALFDNQGVPFVLLAGWRAINHVNTSPFYGKVYDITVEGSRSFIAGGLTVHNCDIHHRHPDYGIHHLLTQDFWIQPYLKTGYRVAARAQDAAAALAQDATIEGS